MWLRCNTDPSRNTLVSPLHHTTTSFLPLPIAKSGMQQGAGPPQEESPGGVLSGVEGEDTRTGSEHKAEAGEAVPRPQDKAAPVGDTSDALARLSVNTDKGPLAAVRQQANSSTSPHASSSQKQDRESLLVMTVSDDGHVWQWDVPLHGFLQPLKSIPPGAASASPAKSPTPGPSPAAFHGQSPPAPAKPALLGLLHTLPHSVTTFSVCPVPVGAGWAGDLNQPSSQSGEGGDAVAVLAAVTSAGNVELITLQRGALTPLSSAISVSLGAILLACKSAPLHCWIALSQCCHFYQKCWSCVIMPRSVCYVSGLFPVQIYWLRVLQCWRP